MTSKELENYIFEYVGQQPIHELHHHTYHQELMKAAKLVGEMLAEREKDKGIKEVIFDRGGYIYHGRVKALAESARKSGLIF